MVAGSGERGAENGAYAAGTDDADGEPTRPLMRGGHWAWHCAWCCHECGRSSPLGVPDTVSLTGLQCSGALHASEEAARRSRDSAQAHVVNLSDPTQRPKRRRRRPYRTTVNSSQRDECQRDESARERVDLFKLEPIRYSYMHMHCPCCMGTRNMPHQRSDSRLRLGYCMGQPNGTTK